MNIAESIYEIVRSESEHKPREVKKSLPFGMGVVTKTFGYFPDRYLTISSIPVMRQRILGAICLMFGYVRFVRKENQYIDYASSPKKVFSL